MTDNDYEWKCVSKINDNPDIRLTRINITVVFFSGPIDLQGGRDRYLFRRLFEQFNYLLREQFDLGFPDHLIPEQYIHNVTPWYGSAEELQVETTYKIRRFVRQTYNIEIRPGYFWHGIESFDDFEIDYAEASLCPPSNS